MWSSRRATIADRDALVELCEASVGSADYVPSFLADFLRTGVVFVAEDAGVLIGMMVYHDVPDGSAWLHAARTRPAYRRRGVASALMGECERLSRRRRRSTMRLWASATNLASVRANRKYGFRERGRFTRMRLEITAPAAGVPLEPIDLATDWKWLEESPLIRRSSGYIFHDFFFMPFNRTTARWLSREGALWRFGGNAVSISRDLEDPGGRNVQIQVLAGDPLAILRAAPGIARSRGAGRVESFLPHDKAILAAARHAGFRFMEWGQEALLFEKAPQARGGPGGPGPAPRGAGRSRASAGRKGSRRAP